MPSTISDKFSQYGERNSRPRAILTRRRSGRPSEFLVASTKQALWRNRGHRRLKNKHETTRKGRNKIILTVGLDFICESLVLPGVITSFSDVALKLESA